MASAMRRSPLAAFVVLAYALSWAWAFPFVAAGDVVRKGVGWPTHFPALLGPALAAVVMTALVWGRTGVRDLLAQMARWRMPLRWWAAALSPAAFLGVALAVASAAPEDLGDDARIYGICTSNSARFLAARAIEEADLNGVIVRERGLVWWLEVDRGTDAPVHVYFYKAPPAGSAVWDLRLDDAEVKRALSASNGRQLELFTSSGGQGHADLLNVIVVHYGDPHDGPGKLDVGAPYISNGELSWDWHERFDMPEDGVGANPAPLLGDDSGGFEGLRLIDSRSEHDSVETEVPGLRRPRETSDSRGLTDYGEMQVRDEPVGDEQQNEGMGEESS